METAAKYIVREVTTTVLEFNPGKPIMRKVIPVDDIYKALGSGEIHFDKVGSSQDEHEYFQVEYAGTNKDYYGSSNCIVYVIREQYDKENPESYSGRVHTHMTDGDVLYFLKTYIEQFNFPCTEQTDEGPYTWQGKILSFRSYGSHYEIKVNARGTDIVVLIGRFSAGWFACMPDYDAGCYLSSSLSDHFYNREKLAAAIGSADGTTVAAAINFISKLIG